MILGIGGVLNGLFLLLIFILGSWGLSLIYFIAVSIFVPFCFKRMEQMIQ